jgi:KDO2-lipid IV(A) lauroyltransferase
VTKSKSRLVFGAKDRMIFWMLAAAIYALSILPDFILYPLGIAGGWLAYHLDRRHIRIGMRNLQIAFPERSDAGRRQILRESYLNLGRSGAEYIRLAGFFHSRLKNRVTYAGLDHLHEAQRKHPGKGVLALSAHIGNFELLAPAHAMHGFPTSLVHHTQRFVAGETLLTFVRERSGVHIIRKHKAAREVLRTLRRGEVIGIPFDQNAKRSEAVWVPFFGELAATPSGLARLAMLSGAPVHPVFIVRQPDGRSHVIEISFEIEPQLTADAAADVLENTRRYQKAVEDAVRKYPSQWLWTHRRFRTRPVRGMASLYGEKTPRIDKMSSGMDY